MEAADESKRQKGAAIELKEVIDKASVKAVEKVNSILK